MRLYPEFATMLSLIESCPDSLLRTVENTAASTQSNMEDALQDIESLAVKARDMVRMAEDLNEKLTVATATHTTSSIIEPEEATFIRSSLSQLGLQMPNAPVTLDMMRDERRWHEELARELASVLQGSGSSWKRPEIDGDQGAGGMMHKRGIIALDEVWGGWNRARGVGELHSFFIFSCVNGQLLIRLTER